MTSRAREIFAREYPHLNRAAEVGERSSLLMRDWFELGFGYGVIDGRGPETIVVGSSEPGRGEGR